MWFRIIMKLCGNECKPERADGIQPPHTVGDKDIHIYNSAHLGQLGTFITNCYTGECTLKKNSSP